MSERALAYSEEPLEHRMLVVFEAAGLASDFASYLVRSLLSEGRVRYETVERDGGQLRPRLIERDGPTGLIVTTTSANLHAENETRLLSITVSDSREQTARVLHALARDGPGEQPAVEDLHLLQDWLTAKPPHDVAVPFASTLADLVPPVAVRLRRDFGLVLSLIRAHALLHRLTRERDGRGRVVAIVDDYDTVRDLVVDLVTEGVGATVSATLRATVEAARQRLAVADRAHVDHPEVRVVELARDLKIDTSSTLRRVQVAIKHGFLINEETRRGRPARLVLGDPLPDDVEVLPTSEELQARGGCRAAGASGGIERQRENAQKTVALAGLRVLQVGAEEVF
jgi:hypothetical protein